MTGDYKFDQTPVDGRPADISRLAELGRDGLTAALRRLDQRRPSRRRPLGVERGPGAAGDLRLLRGPHHRHLLRLQHPPRPAGDRRGGAARPPGGAGRPLDAQKLQHRLQPRHRQSAVGPLHPAARDRELPRREGDRDLDRQPGRAALGPAPDGQQRPPRRRAALRRHRGLLGDPGARQRARRQRDDRPHLRDRRQSRDREGRADPRLRAWLAGGAETDAQPDQTALRAAGPRRPPAPAPARRAGRIGRRRAREHLPGAQRPAAGNRPERRRASARRSTPA